MSLSAPLEDIKDIREFVAWRVGKSLGSNGKLSGEQREDAVDEGVVIVYELHGDWDPLRCARFSAFCMTYLDRRLISWWRKDLRQSGRGSWSGSRNAYTYFKTVSLDSGSVSAGALVVDGPEAA